MSWAMRSIWAALITVSLAFVACGQKKEQLKGEPVSSDDKAKKQTPASGGTDRAAAASGTPSNEGTGKTASSNVTVKVDSKDVIVVVTDIEATNEADKSVTVKGTISLNAQLLQINITNAQSTSESGKEFSATNQKVGDYVIDYKAKCDKQTCENLVLSLVVKKDDKTNAEAQVSIMKSLIGTIINSKDNSDQLVLTKSLNKAAATTISIDTVAKELAAQVSAMVTAAIKTEGKGKDATSSANVKIGDVSKAISLSNISREISADKKSTKISADLSLDGVKQTLTLQNDATVMASKTEKFADIKMGTLTVSYSYWCKNVACDVLMLNLLVKADEKSNPEAQVGLIKSLEGKTTDGAESSLDQVLEVRQLSKTDAKAAASISTLRDSVGKATLYLQ